MSKQKRKYIFTIATLALSWHLVFGLPSAVTPTSSPNQLGERMVLDTLAGDGHTTALPNTLNRALDSIQMSPRDTHLNRPRVNELDQSNTYTPPTIEPDTISAIDSLATVQPEERKKREGDLEDIIHGHNKDSTVYEVRKRLLHIYKDGDLEYQEMNLKADYMEINMDSKNIFAYGITDSLGNKTRPEFIDKGSSYTMDSINFNINTKKAKIKGVATQEGEGYLMAEGIKKAPDNTSSIYKGRYTTCDHDHPHFYLAMSKAKMIPGKKVIIGPSHIVMEDVPIYFPLLPFGFFPITSGRSSGFIIPSYGEVYSKGFFLRDGGYYFAFNDYIDLTALGGFYTEGSWEASLSSRYVKKYTYNGSFNFRFKKIIDGERGDEDYNNSHQYNLEWYHTQDPKHRPGTTFSASVNFSSSGYAKHGSTTVNEMIDTQSNSSIAYSKKWDGKPYTFATSMTLGQNSQDATVSIGFPSLLFNVSRITPFKRRNAVGKERWYEKISMTYKGTMDNKVTVKESDLFSSTMLKDMKNGVKHSIPIEASWSILGHLNVTPKFSYNEVWHFRKIDKEWSPTESQVVADTTFGFYRTYDYNFSIGMDTKMYGMYEFRNSKTKIRHTLAPNISFSYKPDFGKAKYGFYKPYQMDAQGTIGEYSPYSGNAYGQPGKGESMSMSFGLNQTLEMKVKSDRDSTGVRKIKLIDKFNIFGSYDFLKKEFNLSDITVSLGSTVIKDFGLEFTATFDPYQTREEDGKAVRVNKFLLQKGKLARLKSFNTNFGYTFSGGGPMGDQAMRPAMNNSNGVGLPTPEDNDFFNQQNIVDPAAQRMMMTSKYYDFNIPWNLNFSYGFGYTNDGVKKTITQSLTCQASVTLTQKWGLNFSGGYDFKNKRLSYGTVTIARDLHCWQMNLTWVPDGGMKSWMFNISVKSSVLRDLKYDKRSTRYENRLD